MLDPVTIGSVMAGIDPLWSTAAGGVGAALAVRMRYKKWKSPFAILRDIREARTVQKYGISYKPGERPKSTHQSYAGFMSGELVLEPSEHNLEHLGLILEHHANVIWGEVCERFDNPRGHPYHREARAAYEEHDFHGSLLRALVSVSEDGMVPVAIQLRIPACLKSIEKYSYLVEDFGWWYEKAYDKRKMTMLGEDVVKAICQQVGGLA